MSQKCTCGGMLYAHGKFVSKKTGLITERYICKDCKKAISVREGVIVNGTGARKLDWRTMETGRANGDGQGKVDGREVSSARGVEI